MSDSNKVSDLLAAALQGAADAARSRLDRDVTITAAELPSSEAILRFDLSMSTGGRLTWFITNEDATGFSDMLIGGVGDRGAALTEMHLDALTVAFSDMLTKAVESLSSGVTMDLEAGEIDLGMEQSLPDPEEFGTRLTLALEIAGFGPLTVVQHADTDLTQLLDMMGISGVGSVPTPAAAPSAVAAPAEPVPVADDAPAPAGPTPHVTAAYPGAAEQAHHADNVVPLQPATPAASPAMAPPPAPPAGRRGPADLDMLMNVPLPLTVELGRTQRTIRELVSFSVGSVIELGKLAGDPLDIMVNDRVIARGEVVVIDEEFGIRVTEIVSPESRLADLG